MYICIHWDGFKIKYDFDFYWKHIIISYEHTKFVPKRKMPWSDRINSRTIPSHAMVVDTFKIKENSFN